MLSRRRWARLLAAVIALMSIAVLGAANTLGSTNAAGSDARPSVSGLVKLPGETVPAFGTALDRGVLRQIAATPAAGRSTVNLSLVLRRTDEAGFRRFLADVRNPRSSLYRHFLSQRQLAARFGPSARAYRAVLGWLRLQGFSLVQGSANRLTLSVRGTRAQAERAFRVTIAGYRIRGQRRLVYANTQAPALPAGIARDVKAVTGLTDVATPVPPQPHYVRVTHQCVRGTSTCTVTIVVCVNGVCQSFEGKVNLQDEFGDCWKVAQKAVKYLFATKSLPAALAGTLLQAVACGVPWDMIGTDPGCFSFGKPPTNTKLTPCPGQAAARPRRRARSQASGSSLKVGLLEFDTFDQASIGHWLSLVGLDAASQLGRLTEVPVNGGVGVPGPAQGEVLLDIDTVLLDTLPANAQVAVYDAPASTSFAQMFNAMINDGDTVISNSWGQCERRTPLADAQAIDSVLAQAAASGVSVFNSAGDTRLNLPGRQPPTPSGCRQTRPTPPRSGEAR